MNSSIDINGKKLLTIKQAASKISYSRDYITRLARERKIVATQIGRIWYVDIDSIKNYKKFAEHEQDVRKKILSDKRKNDLGIKSAKQDLASTRKLQSGLVVASFSSFVVMTGIMSGVWLNSSWDLIAGSLSQIASVKQGVVVSDDLDQRTFLPEIDTLYSGSANYQVHFSHTFNPVEFGETESGYLLLPQGQSEAGEIERYFSDPVTVVVKETGEKVLMKIDAEGNPYGSEMPFVSVPVNSNSP